MIVIDTETSEVREVSQRPATRGGMWGGAGLLVQRRMWRDRWLLLASVLIVALATFLAYAGPHQLAQTIDRGAADAVTSIGSGANLRITVPAGNPSGDNVTSVRGLPVDAFEERAAEMFSLVPPNTKRILTGYEAWIDSPTFSIIGQIPAEEWLAAEDEDRAPTRTGRGGQYVTFANASAAEMTLLEGEWPAAPDRGELAGGLVLTDTPLIEATVTREFAQTFSVEVGDVLVFNRATSSPTNLRISGIVAPTDPEASIWSRMPWVNEPLLVNQGETTEVRRGTVLVDIPAMAELTSQLRAAFTGNLVAQVDATQVTLSASAGIVRELTTLPQTSDQLMPGGSVVPRVETELGEALQAYPDRARAAMAQMSVVISGVIAVAAVVIALMAQLMLSRREGDIALERARGASVPSTGVRLTIESLLVSATGLAIGFGAARWLAPGLEFENTMAQLVTLTALLAAPVLGVLLARRMWTGRREPANRQDRAKIRKGAAAKRLTLDALAVVLGVVAVIAVRGRGVLQTASEGVDPFLAAAPSLLALAAVVVVLRLYPLPMKLVQAFSRRTRGVGGVIALAKARQKIPALPLLALTLAIAVAVSGGLIVSTVRAGQVDASWERVVGDVRVDGEVSAFDAQLLREDGLTVSRAYYLQLATLALGSLYEDTSLLAVDDSYSDVLVAGGEADVSALVRLSEAAAQWSPGDPIPVLASEEILESDVYGSSSMYVGRTFLDVDLIGPVGPVPDGWASGPYLMAPLDLLLEADTELGVASNITFAVGDGAEAKISALPQVDPETVTSRAQWLTRVQDSALIGGVELAMVLAVSAVAILAAVGLLVTVLRGVRERGRALAMLRTQGLASGWGWWLALTELAPAVAAALVGGGAAGVLIVQLLGSSLGLEILAGGITPPPIKIDWTLMGAAGGGVVLLLIAAVAVEVMNHRRDRLSDVLRYGETR